MEPPESAQEVASAQVGALTPVLALVREPPPVLELLLPVLGRPALPSLLAWLPVLAVLVLCPGQSSWELVLGLALALVLGPVRAMVLGPVLELGSRSFLRGQPST